MGCGSQLQQWTQDFRKDFRLPHETKIVGMGAIRGALAVVAQQVLTRNIIEVFDTGLFQPIECPGQFRPVSKVILEAALHQEGVGHSPVLD